MSHGSFRFRFTLNLAAACSVAAIPAGLWAQTTASAPLTRDGTPAAGSTNATPPQQGASPAATSPKAYSAATVIRGGTPGRSPSEKSPSTPPSEPFQDRLERQREEQRRQEQEWANRPTNWQLQNPSGEQNRFATDKALSGNLAPNTYYGAQFRDWNRLSPPVYERQLPPNMQAVPPVTRTNVMLAPYTYWGAENQRWNQVSPGGATVNPLGGWTTRVGW